MKSNFEQKGRGQTPGEKQVCLAKVDGVKLKGDSEHRRSRWGGAGDKATCSECGNTDRFIGEMANLVSEEEKVGRRETDG